MVSLIVAEGWRQQEGSADNCTLLVIFAICWIPLGIIIVLQGVNKDVNFQPWKIAFYWMAYTNSFLNPFCFAISNKPFYNCVFKLLKSVFWSPLAYVLQWIDTHLHIISVYVKRRYFTEGNLLKLTSHPKFFKLGFDTDFRTFLWRVTMIRDELRLHSSRTDEPLC